MRLLLFTGKGGAGRSTVAAATAVHAARCGVKTLLASVDAGGALGDGFVDLLGEELLGPSDDDPLGAGSLDGGPVELEPGLSAVRLDAGDRAARSGRPPHAHGRLPGRLAGVLDQIGLDPPDAVELVALPAVEELLVLLELRDLVAGGGFDLIVLDCPPTARTLRLLALPETVSHALERALPVDRRVRRALAAGARAGAGGPARDHLVEAAERLHQELTGVREVLAGPGTSTRLVFTPDVVATAQARRSRTALALYGHRVDAVVANRVLPAATDDGPGWAARRRSQAARLAELETAFDPVPVLRLEQAAAEPVGPTALAALAEELYGPPSRDAATRLLAVGPIDPAAVAPGAGFRVERDGTDFELVLALPLARRERLTLQRAGDQVRVGVDGLVRVFSLPSALRRCEITGAALRDGALRVRFRPDPALWRSL